MTTNFNANWKMDSTFNANQWISMQILFFQCKFTFFKFNAKLRGYNFALKLKILNLHWNSLFCIESAISFWVCIESGIRFLICIETGIKISVCIEIRIKISICIEVRFFLHWNSLKHSRRIFKFENIFYLFQS